MGRRIRQARRELGLTQADLASQIGISLGTLDRFETGKGDPSDKLEQIAEVTGKPVSWYTSTDQHDAGELNETGLTAELRRRLVESGGRRGSGNADLAEEGDPPDLAEAGSPHPTGYATGRPEDQPTPTESSEVASDAHAFEELPEERTALVLEQQELRTTLAVEREEHAANAARMAEELERVNENQQALTAMLEDSQSELATSHAQGVDLAQRVSQLESEVRVARESAAQATARFDQAETELERLRSDERALDEELELRAAELGARSDELDSREAAVTDAGKDVGFRSTQLDAREAKLRFLSAQLDTREAELRLRSAQLDTREAELRLRSAQLDTPDAELGVRPTRLDVDDAAVVDVEPRVAEVERRKDVFLAVAPDHGYRLVACEGAVPDPGAIVELGEVRYRCLRVQGSPFPGDNRRCAVLELLPRETGPTSSTEPPAE